VPNEVVARMGPLAEPGKGPAKATGLAEARAPMF